MKKRSDKTGRGFFRTFGHILDIIRKIVLNLIFWSLMGFLIFALIPRQTKIQENTLLYLQPQGQIVDTVSISDYPSRLSPLLNRVSETSSIDMGKAIRRAAEDDRISGMVLDCSYLEYASLAVLQDLDQDFAFFKDQGKRIYAWSSSYNQYAYCLASSANIIYLDEMGALTLSGFGVYRTYFKKGMDKWDLDMAVFQAGEFKSFVEPYLYEEMSPAVKEDNLRWTGNLWNQVLDSLAVKRGLNADKLKSWIDAYPDKIFSSELREAQYAKDGGLVDINGTWETFSSDMIRITGYENRNRGFRSIPWTDYLDSAERKEKGHSGKSVAVVTASGEIHSGSGNAWSIGSASLIRRLEMAEQERSVRAIVLRLDTGGGSAYAAEEIRRTLERLRSRGITVVVSMGGVTASGGYWIACEADELWGAPGTITGSIGVFSMIPETDRFLEEHLGITGDGVGTTWLSGQGRPDQPLNRSSRRVLQAGVDSTYRQFLSIVSENREIPLEDLKPMAEGRIWTGEEALELGLLDNTGTLMDAIQKAAQLAHLDTYNIYYVPQSPQGLSDLFAGYLGQITGLFRSPVLPESTDFLETSLTPGRIYALSPVSNKKNHNLMDNSRVRY